MTWSNKPISRTCEVRLLHGTRICGEPTRWAYRAAYGWMALCPEHAKKHSGYVTDIHELIEQGYKMEKHDPTTPL